ncbi:hypothetical protein ASPZODRAFT_74138 [Penicilliopsis zonata CBS 506.65]|uniref:DUF1996 domain-containing protein n=1 Tax=Penicilliopsis zonata CBS 506.65 TaxID=1073090 RepID=A0A1L9S929_9EURO|nr:hypothetical protein ASPZODRAFT_74138 [Penicilliopsis zonata CBS 506.65]OJJ43682.1 hypothetical protein ASPZODRAFT_74138 [Penicilliopsis zonata CBS 506.65]
MIVPDGFISDCNPLTIQRSDPVYFPGTEGIHVHAIAGGTAFQRTMGPRTALAAKNTTCGFSQDKSNYWVPQLYYHLENGSFALMEFVNMPVWYRNRACDYVPDREDCDGASLPRAPPAGLRMVAGNPFLRTYNSSDIAQRAIYHECNIELPSGKITKVKSHELPRRSCVALSLKVWMQSCWDGKNLDSVDHVSHLAYPAIGDYDGGVCPETHPVAIATMMVSAGFNVEPYPDYENWVYSMGDPTGYGLHAELISGWTDEEAMRQGLETCSGVLGVANPDCTLTQGKMSNQLWSGVAQVPEVPAPKEELGQDGPIPKLPGNNPVTA